MKVSKPCEEILLRLYENMEGLRAKKFGRRRIRDLEGMGLVVIKDRKAYLTQSGLAHLRDLGHDVTLGTEEGRVT